MKKFLSKTIAAGILVSLSAVSASADVASTALPVFNHGTNVNVTTGNNNDMNIQITGDKQFTVGEAHWDSFNIGSNASVNVEFTAHNQTSLNYVDAAGGLSQIYGKFTDSGCNGCGYAGTGKVILINPNGAIFGSSADVNLNSFTVSNMNAKYTQPSDSAEGTLALTKTGIVLTDENGNPVARDIAVMEGAKIYGDKNVTFASDDNIYIYKNSQITTNTADLNVDTTGDRVYDATYGKVKLVTADGVNFKYQNSGTVESVSNVLESDRAMTLWLGENNITSGHIDIRNASNNAASEINIKNANLKATKATKGNDGNIWLTANNKVITGNATLDAGGDIYVSSSKKTTIGSDNLNAGGYVKLIAKDGDVVVDNSTVTAVDDVTLSASNIASVQNKSTIKGKDVTVDGTTRGQVIDQSSINANNIVVKNGDVWFKDASLTASEKIAANANGYILSTSTSTFDAPDINFNANGNVTGYYDLKDNKTTINSGNNIDVTLYNVADKNNGLTAKAVNDVTINTPGTLSVSSLISDKGNMTIKANKVVKGLPYTTVEKLPGDNTDRSLISVRYGTFTTDPAMQVTASGGEEFIGEDGNTYQVKHHIQYGDEKILLINPRLKAIEDHTTPVVAVADTETPNPNDKEIERTKIPQQLETYNDNVDIKNNRTETSTIFAAAAAIEIDED